MIRRSLPLAALLALGCAAPAAAKIVDFQTPSKRIVCMYATGAPAGAP